jgi:hypothetical protein
MNTHHKYKTINHIHCRTNAWLKTHGLTPVLYIPTVGVEDADLRKALDEFAFSGQVILTSDGTVIGGFAGSAAKGPRPDLRHVVPTIGKD